MMLFLVLVKRLLSSEDATDSSSETLDARVIRFFALGLSVSEDADVFLVLWERLGVTGIGEST
jgi:hypothetical protein